VRKHLSDRTVKALKPDPERRLFIYDTDLLSFGLSVFPSGTKTWFVEYGARGKRKRFTLGRWPKMNAGTARREAKKVFGEIANGGDPVARRKEEREAAAQKVLTFGAWVDDYLEDVKGRKKRPDHDLSHLRRAKARWKHRPLTSITTNDVSNAMRSERRRAARSKRAAGRDGTLPGATTANRWLAAVSACFTAAVKAGHIERNPAANVAKDREAPPRARVLDSEELARLIAAIQEEPDEHVRAAFFLLVQTGARLSEVLHARWEDFDLEASPPSWRIPSPKAGYPQTMPLHPRTAAMLGELKRIGHYVIPGRSGDKPRSDLRGPWARLKARAALPVDVTIHDIRRTYGLHVARTAGLHVASKLLRHADVRITEKVYAPLGLGDLADAVKKAGTPGEVVDIAAARKKAAGES